MKGGAAVVFGEDWWWSEGGGGGEGRWTRSPAACSREERGRVSASLVGVVQLSLRVGSEYERCPVERACSRRRFPPPLSVVSGGCGVVQLRCGSRLRVRCAFVR